MIYALFISIILIIIACLYYPYLKINGEYKTIKVKNIITKKGHVLRVSIPLILTIVALIVLLILDLTLNDLFIDPVAFEIFGLEVRWYALWILLGVVVAVILGVKEGKRIGIYSDFIYTGILITLPLAIIGARIWYVLFNLDEFQTFGDVIGLRDGWAGLGIQGGVIMAIIVVFLYCKKTKVSLYKALDLVAPGFLIGQIFGRWGNFCNHELYGPLVENEALFRFFLPKFISENMYIESPYLLNGLSAGYYQPMFLYESLLNLVGLCILLIARKKSKKLESGDMLGLYLIWYGIVRTITESFRFEGEVLLVGNIRVSIVVSVVFIICGIAFLILKRKFGPRTNYLELVDYIKNNKIDTILFDLDGTILDSKELIYRSFVHTFEKYFPNHELTDAELDSFFGPPLASSFGKYTDDPNKINEMIEYYRSYNIEAHDELVSLFPGVKDTLKFLHKHNYKLGVVSAKKTELVNHALEHFNIIQYFDVVIGQDEVSKPKPNPEGIYKACQKLKATRTLYVGDSVSDIEAGKNAKVKTCAIAYKKDNGRAPVLQAADPDYFIDSMYGLTKVLGE